MRIDLHTIRTIADMISDSDEREADPGFLDTLEGETDAMEVADYLIAEALADDALAKATKDEEEALRVRRGRFEHRASQKRKALLDLLNAVGVSKLERPRATISKRAGSERVEIIDEASVPSQLCTVKTTTTPDKAAIRAQIKAGSDVPGAAIVRGDDSLTLRIA